MARPAISQTCKASGCYESGRRHRGYCQNHYRSVRLCGNPYDRVKKPAPIISCSVAGCERRAIARALCTQHYQRWAKRGDPTVVTKAPAGTCQPSWLYGIWGMMMRRCHNPACDRYKDYGGRGIFVCERWQDFQNFKREVPLPRPSPSHTLDRRDNDGGYEPGNVRWATPREQRANRRANT